MKKSLTPATAPSPDVLTKREHRVLQLIVVGMRNREIAKEIEVSIRTVETFRAHIFKKLKLDTTQSLVFYAIRHGIIDNEGNPISNI